MDTYFRANVTSYFSLFFGSFYYFRRHTYMPIPHSSPHRLVTEWGSRNASAKLTCHSVSKNCKGSICIFDCLSCMCVCVYACGTSAVITWPQLRIMHSDGVLFVTYSSLASRGRRNTKQTRLQEIMEWSVILTVRLSLVSCRFDSDSNHLRAGVEGKHLTDVSF